MHTSYKEISDKTENPIGILWQALKPANISLKIPEGIYLLLFCRVVANAKKLL